MFRKVFMVPMVVTYFNTKRRIPCNTAKNLLISPSAECRVRPVVLIIKKWAQHHRINDASRGTLSSYTLVLMVLHYLQSE